MWQIFDASRGKGVMNGDLRPPLPFARPRKIEIARADDSWISTNVAQREIGCARHYGLIENAELVART